MPAKMLPGENSPHKRIHTRVSQASIPAEAWGNLPGRRVARSMPARSGFGVG